MLIAIISTHTPSWGVTDARYSSRAILISTHTPSWGVTASPRLLILTDDFYSHALVGRDNEAKSNIIWYRLISTHTPSWGVTGFAMFPIGCMFISTHTPSWGVT